MSNRAARCSEAEIKRAIRAVQATKAEMSVEILPDGTIRIAPARVIQNQYNGLSECLDSRPAIHL